MPARARPLLGTIVEMHVDERAGGDALPHAFEQVAHVERLMSFHRADSDLGRLHAAALDTPVAVHPWTFHVLRHAQRLFRLSGGLFDPTIARTLVARGLLPAPAGRVPDAGACFDAVELHAGCRVLRRRDVWIDLGGIAKGFAVDVAVATLRRAGATAGAVSAGGDLRVFGDAPQPVSVRDPDAPARTRVLGHLTRGAVATSGRYFASSFGFPDDAQAIVATTPHAARAAARHASVSVIAPRCIWADALTKLVMLAGADTPLTAHVLQSHHAHAVVS
ncbi:FAD:protein FMN transferase [Burkholderia ubonensis]|uniref:FAD:protein FMN transferase n=1 Tax=Burkholderia ubonensis TaxID=101571 RepID=UPI00075659D6|nr:FAD:protein FMN transferase [Burkholderia ubonensis]KVA72419.1 thiamine biosynthesis protein ApbE [Burkholderia ubonensis]KVG30135.1 thiamine biosynthesis protein ApbE [Burkholderia ubonensis]OJA63313.1 thiamine biosynthesis protein ApbE [Burkholderia ubonensis]